MRENSSVRLKKIPVQKILGCLDGSAWLERSPRRVTPLQCNKPCFTWLSKNGNTRARDRSRVQIPVGAFTEFQVFEAFTFFILSSVSMDTLLEFAVPDLSLPIANSAPKLSARPTIFSSISPSTRTA